MVRFALVFWFDCVSRGLPAASLVHAPLMASGILKQMGDGLKEELSDADESLLEDQKFLAELEKGCATKEKEWAEICKLRSEEVSFAALLCVRR